MLDEMKIWKFQIYAERAWRLAMDIAIESGRLGKRGIGLAVIADETRRVADKLYLNLEAIKNGGIIDTDFSEMLERINLLAQNGCIEMIKLNEYSLHNTDTMGVAVIVDEIRKLALNLMELLEYQKVKFIDVPEIICCSKVTDIGLFLLQATIGGIPFVENIRYIQEIISYNNSDTSFFDLDKKLMNLRGMKVPVVNCYSKLGLAEPNSNKNNQESFAIIVNTDWYEPNNLIAILVDDISSNSIFRTKLGISTSPKASMFPVEFIRECWDTIGDNQILFLDWKELYKQ